MQSVADIKQAAKVLELARAGVSYRLIARQIGLSKNTVEAIVTRDRAASR